MISILKKTLKIGVVTAGVAGLTTLAAFALVGEDRTKAVVSGLHGKVLESIDENIDDPTALRAQLREMEREYPERIAQVRGDLAELGQEIRALEREKAISERVVALAEEDVGRVEAQLASAPASAGPGEARLAATRVRLGETTVASDRLRTRLKQIQNTRTAYANRAADAEHDLVYLYKQASRLEELLAKLEAERAEFQGQILALSRQVDAIARNDRLIGLLEKRNRTIEECSRYEAASLDQINGRLAQIQAHQEAELDLLSSAEEQADYEDVARMQLAQEQLEARRDGEGPWGEAVGLGSE